METGMVTLWGIIVEEDSKGQKIEYEIEENLHIQQVRISLDFFKCSHPEIVDG